MRAKKLVLFSLAKVHMDSAGRFRTHIPTLSQQSMAPFLRVFSVVDLHVRVIPGHVEDEGYEVGGPGLNVITLPYYEGIAGYLLVMRRMHKAIRGAVQEPGSHYGTWVSSHIAGPLTDAVTKIDAPLLSIVIGDGYEVAKSIIPWPVKGLAARISLRSTRRIIRASSAVVYVTLKALQRRYPADPGVPTLARTDMRISDDLFSIPPKETPFASPDRVSLIAVGSQQQNYKGHDLLLSAIAVLQSQGYQVTATIVGDGLLHRELIEQANTLDVRDVAFVRSLGSSDDVARAIRTHDIFVMPSRTEGMPRALLEAMAVGTLSLGSRVGGIPEVLDDECLFEPNSVDAIVESLRAVVNSSRTAMASLEAQRKTIRTIWQHHYGDEVLSTYLAQWTERTDHGRDERND